MKKISKLFFSLFVLSLLVLPTVAVKAAAGDLSANYASDTGINNVSQTINLSQNDPITTATRIINMLMMFLGIIAVVIILIGGFKWMTAMGSEDKIKKAQQLMSAGVVGLVIILAAWGIANFVVTKLATTV